MTMSPWTTADNRDSLGTGTVVVSMNYTGGTYWLSKNGPWGDGVNDWTGTLRTTSRSITYQYVNYVLITGREDIQSSGVFDGINCALTFAIANGVYRGTTGILPANYPALLDPDCSSTRTAGTWGDVKDLTLLIDCVVPAQITSWGNLKAIYPRR